MDQNTEEQRSPSRFRTESQRIRREVRIQTVTYIVAALGLVAGLAWNEAIKGLIEHFFKGDQNSLTAKFIYAVLITLVVAIFSMYLIRFKDEEEK